VLFQELKNKKCYWGK